MKTYLIAYYDNYDGIYQGRSRTLEVISKTECPMGQIIFNRLDSEFRPDQRENTSEHK